jgi:hypothetical protein
MKTKPTTPKNIDKYIAAFPKDVQDILKKQDDDEKSSPFQADVCNGVQ